MSAVHHIDIYSMLRHRRALAAAVAQLRRDEAWVLFVSGPIAAGKTTTAQALAARLEATVVDFDEFGHGISSSFDEETGLWRHDTSGIDDVLNHGIERVNRLSALGASVVASYVLGAHCHTKVSAGLHAARRHFVTLVPPIEVALSGRGREISDWERARIEVHYASDVVRPASGHVIDNGALSINEAVEEILRLTGLGVTAPGPTATPASAA